MLKIVEKIKLILNKMNIKNILQDNNFKDKYILKTILKDFFCFTEEELYKNWQKKITKNEFIKIERKYKDYIENNIPIEYILWYTYFMWEKIYVNKNTLIPRPETEYLINYAYDFFKKNTDYKIFDIWTWSWIIWNMLNKLTKQKVICSDISEKALDIAKKNNKNNIYIKSNLWEHINKYSWKLLICSNLPYVKENFKLDNFVKNEPSIALFAWKDWLTLYRKLIEEIFKLDNEISCFFELTKEQGKTLIKEYNINWKLLKTCHNNIVILNFSLQKKEQ